jgi:nucleotide-binding universal stress UspA family protein
MMSYTHILAPTDFSPLANHALTYAFKEAELHNAKLTLLHALHHHSDEVYYIKGQPTDPRGLAGELGSMTLASGSTPITIRRDYVEEALLQLREMVPPSFTSVWETEVASGSPAEAIVRLAQERQVDLIVMGTHGRTGLSHILLGSVAEKVVREAPCPVLIIRYRPDAAVRE